MTINIGCSKSKMGAKSRKKCRQNDFSKSKLDLNNLSNSKKKKTLPSSRNSKSNNAFRELNSDLVADLTVFWYIFHPILKQLL